MSPLIPSSSPANCRYIKTSSLLITSLFSSVCTFYCTLCLPSLRPFFFVVLFTLPQVRMGFLPTNCSLSILERRFGFLFPYKSHISLLNFFSPRIFAEVFFSFGKVKVIQYWPFLPLSSPSKYSWICKIFKSAFQRHFHEFPLIQSSNLSGCVFWDLIWFFSCFCFCLWFKYVIFC